MTKLLAALTVLVAFSMILLGVSHPSGYESRIIIGPANSPLGTPAGQAPSNLQIAVSLSLFDPQTTDSLNQLLEALYSPQSPVYHQFLTSQQYTANFAPTSQAYQQAVAYFQSQGLQVYTDKSRFFLNLAGTVSQFQNAFSTSIQLFKSGGSTYYANTVPLSLPQSIAPYVTSAIGFQNNTYFKPTVMTVPVPPTTQPYQPATLQSGYNETALLNAGVNGAGQNIVVVGALAGDPTGQADLAEFSLTYNLTVPVLNIVYVNASATIQDVVADPGGIAQSPLWDLENALDIEWSHAVAPNAGITMALGVEEGPGLAEAIATGIAAHTGNIVSQSFGLWESDANNTACCGTVTGAFNVGAQSFIGYLHPFYEMAAATGITVLGSSGDSGSTSGCCSGTAPPVSVNYPAVDPFVTAVGGTNLQAAGCTSIQITLSQCGGWQGETAWVGAGGGFSTLFARPQWEAGPGVPISTPSGYAGSVTLSNGTLARALPDIGADADPASGVVIVLQGVNLGLVTSIGGTSLASPVWGGIIAMANGATNKQIGLFSPTAYQILNAQIYGSSKSPFHDVTVGNNSCDVSNADCTGIYSSPPGYSATKGWDPVTGVGSPNVGFLVSCLTNLTACLNVIITVPPVPSGVTITSPTSGQTITTTSLAVAGTHSLPPGNWILGPPNSAPGYQTGVQQNQLNVLAGWITNYRLINGQGYFDAKLNMSDLTNLSTVPAPATGEAWYLLWGYGGTTWFATMQLTATGTVSNSLTGIGISFGIGHVQSTATGGSFFNTTDTATGTYTPTAPGTITITVPTSLVGGPSLGSTLTGLTGSTYEVVGFPVGLLEKVDSQKANTPYNLGDPLMPDGFIQVALNSNYLGTTNGTLVNYPSRNNWQATLNLAGLSAGAQSVFARQVINGVPGTSASVSFNYSPTVQSPVALTVTTNSLSYSPGQNVKISGVLKNPTTGQPISGAAVSLIVADPLGSIMYTHKSTTNSTGGYSASLHLSKNALPGSYTVYASSNGNSATAKFQVTSASPAVSNAQVSPGSGGGSTVFTVSATTTDDVAIYTVYAVIVSQTGQTITSVTMSHQGSGIYTAIFTLPITPTGTYTAKVYSTDVAGQTASATSNSFTIN